MDLYKILHVGSSLTKEEYLGINFGKDLDHIADFRKHDPVEVCTLRVLLVYFIISGSRIPAVSQHPVQPAANSSTHIWVVVRS